MEMQNVMQLLSNFVSGDLNQTISLNLLANHQI